MTMNKKEKAELEALKSKLRVAAAFYRTQPIKPDVPIPDRGFSKEEASRGFLYLGDPLGSFGGARIEEAWSTCVTHGTGIPSRNSSGSQNGCPLFSTRLLALRAMRYTAEQNAAERLAKIDQMIEAELAKEISNGN